MAVLSFKKERPGYLPVDGLVSRSNGHLCEMTGAY
jgi:hypothetical protein